VPETVAVPVAVLPTKFTEQLPAVSIQLAALNEPPVVPADSVKVTAPVGVIAVPVVDVSVTVAVHTEVWSTTIVLGLQSTAIAEVRTVTVIVLEAVGPLPL
jgi:hypothetical protein